MARSKAADQQQDKPAEQQDNVEQQDEVEQDQPAPSPQPVQSAPVDETVTAAAPLSAPDRAAQLEPADGHVESSTDNLAAQAALRSPAGANFVRLVDTSRPPRELDVNTDVFDFPVSGQDSKTTATVKTHVVEVYTGENARTESQQLLLSKGSEVPVWQANQILAKYQELTGKQPPGTDSES